VAMLSDCLTPTEAREHPSQWKIRGFYAWVFTAAVGFKQPIPARGRQGIYNVDIDAYGPKLADQLPEWARAYV